MDHHCSTSLVSYKFGVGQRLPSIVVVSHAALVCENSTNGGCDEAPFQMSFTCPLVGLVPKVSNDTQLASGTSRLVVSGRCRGDLMGGRALKTRANTGTRDVELSR